MHPPVPAVFTAELRSGSRYAMGALRRIMPEVQVANDDR